MLRVVDCLRLVDQHDGNVVDDRVPQLQPRVVEALLVLEIEERALVARAGQNIEQLCRECHDLTLQGHVRTHLSHTTFDVIGGRGLQIQPQQRFGVRRPEVEPPITHIDRQTIETVLT